MRFVDEATIFVQAGKGGDGCLSFRREKFIPFGGPNGGNGGIGGSIYLEGAPALNTLIDFRHQRQFQAKNGQRGMGTDCTGRQGEDLVIQVPVGTTVWDNETHNLIGDILQVGQRLMVAEGGFHGFGNAHFKTSTNRAPRRFTLGMPGEARELRLELKLLADVGLLGLPNAGKSTFIRAVSAATPKVADYPFTTLHPSLGVVSLGYGRSFVIADIPGIIEGAAEGVGLGFQFLRHLTRTSLLLHIVDMLPINDSDPLENIKVINAELALYNAELAAKPQWLVLNKLDLISQEEAKELKEKIQSSLNWQGPIFMVSGVDKSGVSELCQAIMTEIEKIDMEDVPVSAGDTSLDW